MGLTSLRRYHDKGTGNVTKQDNINPMKSDPPIKKPKKKRSKPKK